MSFTYDMSSAIGKLRLQIADRTLGAGPWPDSSNFSDEELTELLAEEGSQGRAQAAVAEVLAAAWGTIADISEGPLHISRGKTASSFLTLSERLRLMYGGGFQTYSVSFHRADGYSMYGGDNPLIGANLSDYFRARLIIHRGWTT
jgi:hypothetical protein